MIFLKTLHCYLFDRQTAKTVAISSVLEPPSFCVKIKSQSLQNILLKWLIFLMDYEKYEDLLS